MGGIISNYNQINSQSSMADNCIFSTIYQVSMVIVYALAIRISQLQFYGSEVLSPNDWITSSQDKVVYENITYICGYAIFHWKTTNASNF